jgi:hypothetical protein
MPKPQVPHDTQQIWPADCIKSLGYVQFYEKRGSPFLVEIYNHLFYVNKVIMDAPLFNEDRLIDGDELVKLGGGGNFFAKILDIIFAKLCVKLILL